jgi:hypothetical protein
VICPFDCGTNKALAETIRLTIAVGNRRGGENEN